MKNNKGNKPATIYDIARMTGFTGATVSRVLNNNGYIAENTREKIMEAARKLNYSPNPAARTLKTKKTNQIMLSIPDIRNEYFFELIASMHEVTNRNGYSLLLNYTESDIKEELNMLKKVRENYFDGLVLISMNFTKKHLDEIRNIKQPIVLSTMSCNKIDSPDGLFDFVGVDTRKGTYLTTRHLIDQGHVRIGYLGLPLNTQTGDERFAGYCMAMNEASLEVDEELVMTGAYSEEFGYQKGKLITKISNKPTAVCAGNDALALGLYRAFEEDGIRIPEDIGVVGMDNIYISSRIRPKLTSIAMSQDKIGKLAAEFIFERINGLKEPSRTVVFEPELVVRESSIRRKSL